MTTEHKPTLAIYISARTSGRDSYFIESHVWEQQENTDFDDSWLVAKVPDTDCFYPIMQNWCSHYRDAFFSSGDLVFKDLCHVRSEELLTLDTFVKRTQRKLEALRKRFGPPSDFGDMVLRFADVLDIDTFLADRKNQDWGRFRTMDADSLKWEIQALEREWLEPEKYAPKMIAAPLRGTSLHSA